MMPKYILTLLFTDWFIHSYSNNLSLIVMSVPIVGNSNEVRNKDGKRHPAPPQFTFYLVQ